MESASPLVLPGALAGSDRPRARTRPASPPRSPFLYGGIAALVAALVVASFYAPAFGSQAFKPIVELGKLIAAAAIGLVITRICRHLPGEKPAAAAMQQAQVLLCVSGAVMMLIIGDSLARAFGILGAASIIRFRTPVKDPRSITILFLLMGLGMAVGLGAYSLAGLGTAFLCIFLSMLARLNGEDQPRRALQLRLASAGPEFPGWHVTDVLERSGATFEPREVQQGDQVVSVYQVSIPLSASLDDLTRDLLAAGRAGIKAVTWEKAKKGG